MIGRAPDANLIVNDERVSRHHATIACEDDEWRLKDVSSRNGTYLNEARIADEPLRDRDRIRIDRTVLRFSTATDVEATYHDEIYELMLTVTDDEGLAADALSARIQARQEARTKQQAG